MRSNNVIGYITEGFPGVMTFLEREILGLIQHGWDVSVFALHKETLVHYAAELDQSLVDTHYCLNRHLLSFKMLQSHLRILLLHPKVYFQSILFLLRTYRTTWYSFSRAIYAFMKAGYFYADAKSLGVEHLHAHFAGRTVDVAIFLSQFLDVGFSFTGHSNDVTGNYPLLQNKINLASFVVAENERALEAMKSHIISDVCTVRAHIVHPGVNTQYFRPNRESKSDVPTLIAVTRLVESKGLDDLVRACSVLRDKELQFHCNIVGDGPVYHQLQSQIHNSSLGEYITLNGALTSVDIVQLLSEAWIFVLPCVRILGGQGDHPGEFVSVVEDGIPSSIVEAMSVGLPVVTTDVGSLPEIVENSVNGIVISERDPDGLSEALLQLIDDSALRDTLGRKARKTIIADFDTAVCTSVLGSLMSTAINNRRVV
ncbi:MAG TPA: glycosyltransferase [Anaerolineales bacterium]|jgi:glycosyltransferase involved in cell wall biosynthesis|nr:glycosyltransferase [Anaerolineales bacterium]|tara:strand:- start:995 stop:2275 length:1281 start_codon:yes stop_codon:yes gene_type:complete